MPLLIVCKEEMKQDNQFGRLLMLLLLTLLICLGMYWLPDKVLGHPIKTVDLLSDIRVKEGTISLDSLKRQLAAAEVDSVEVVVQPDTLLTAANDSIRLVMKRDSLSRAIYANRDTITPFEDFTPDHSGLHKFYAALAKREKLGRPVRIAFLGDSFVEGDILVADLRSQLQKEFGGRGVGFVPVTSNIEQFRPTTNNKAEGWKTHSLLQEQKEVYTLPCMYFEPVGDEASITFKTSRQYARLGEISSLKFIYTNSDDTEMRLEVDNDTIRRKLPPTETIMQITQSGKITEGSFTFTHAENLRALGIALEDNNGITVDNYALRGNSGMIMTAINQKQSREFNKIRTYDLIIMQYGLNVMTEEMLDYSWYTQRMMRAVAHVQQCFPNADILIMGISDRSFQEEGEFKTMPAVVAMSHAQKQLARQSKVVFWDTYEAMGGENSMVHYVQNNWASKDYTHLSFSGGKQIAKKLVNAILLEKEFYDEMGKAEH